KCDLGAITFRERQGIDTDDVDKSETSEWQVDQSRKVCQGSGRAAMDDRSALPSFSEKAFTLAKDFFASISKIAYQPTPHRRCLERLNRLRSSEPAQKFAGTGKSSADGTPQGTAMTLKSEERRMYQ